MRSIGVRGPNTYLCRLEALIKIDAKLCFYPFLATFSSYRNQSIDLQRNQLTGFYMMEHCHEKDQ